jgi:hypothetical protein
MYSLKFGTDRTARLLTLRQRPFTVFIKVVFSDWCKCRLSLLYQLKQRYPDKTTVTFMLVGGVNSLSASVFECHVEQNKRSKFKHDLRHWIRKNFRTVEHS